MIGEIRQNFTEASASVGLILATALAFNNKHFQRGRKFVAKRDFPILNSYIGQLLCLDEQESLNLWVLKIVGNKGIPDRLEFSRQIKGKLMSNAIEYHLQSSHHYSLFPSSLLFLRGFVRFRTLKWSQKEVFACSDLGTVFSLSHVLKTRAWTIEKQ